MIDEASAAGARYEHACEAIGLSLRTIQRWRKHNTLSDLRRGPLDPGNKFTTEEEISLLKALNSKEYVDKTPFYIVPHLADKGLYLGSESTCYRVLRKYKLNAHRGKSQIKKKRTHQEIPKAKAPNQIWSWDITYLKSPIHGKFYYLYLFMDIYSRKIVGWDIHNRECTLLGSDLLERIVVTNGISGEGLQVHSDNGSPMRGSAMRFTMQKLGVIPSFSRPSVSNDNSYSESLFKTLKYLPEYPIRPFQSQDHAYGWVSTFVNWYNHQHLHSGIGFVTPEDKHNGRAEEMLEKRKLVYNEARKRNPHRWTKSARTWETPVEARLFVVK